MNTISKKMLDNVYLIVLEAYSYQADNSEAMLIVAIDEVEDYFVGEGMDSGAEYRVGFSEVDFNTDKFYKLVEVQHGY